MYQVLTTLKSSCNSCIVTNHCSDCECFGGATGDGVHNALVGNGYCNDEYNNADCNYDGGDCCPTPDLLANGICNDETNNGTCSFDFGDCCLSSCSDCGCSATGIITSPGYPGNYANYLDVSWHIQVPSGQLIEINFIISFDVESHSSCR